MTSQSSQDVVVTAWSATSNRALTSNNLAIINSNQIECYAFSASSSASDQVLSAFNYQGQIDWFISSVSQPFSTSSSFVKMSGKQISTNHAIVVKRVDRTNWGASNLYLCGLAYGDSSAQVTLQE